MLVHHVTSSRSNPVFWRFSFFLLCISPFTWTSNQHLQNSFSLAFVPFSQKRNHRVENIACWNPNVLKYNNLLTQIHFTQCHFQQKNWTNLFENEFSSWKNTETFISPVSILKNIVSKAIRYMLCHFHNLFDIQGRIDYGGT